MGTARTSSPKSRARVVAFDLDGTLAVKCWPGIGEPFDGAVAAVNELHESGCECILYTYRISPNYFSGAARPPADVFEQEQNVTDWLHKHGLSFMKVWKGEGKPNYHVLVDDRAIRFPGTDRAWPRTLQRVKAAVELGHTGA